MGQPVLRNAEKSVAKVLDVCKSTEGYGGVFRRGIRLIFLSLVTEIDPVKRILCGNAIDLWDVGESPGKSCLFFVRCLLHGIGLTGDMENSVE